MIDLNKDKDMFELQSEMRARTSVSVPWLQQKYGISYKNARPLISELAALSIIQEPPVGIEYRIIQQNLVFRRLRRDELETLYNELTTLETKLLMHILVNKKMTMEELAEIDSNRSLLAKPTADKLSLLLKHGLIYEMYGYYVSRVSKLTVTVLNDVLTRKSMVKQNGDEKAATLALFDRLFED